MGKRRTSNLLIAGGAMAVLALCGLLLLNVDSTSESSDQPEDSKRVEKASRVAPAKREGTAAKKVRSGAKRSAGDTTGASRPQPDDESEFTPAEQKTVDAIQDALDNEDFKKLAAQLKDASSSANPSVRAKAVEALQWFGAKALPELAMFMADDDDDVRTSAIDAWTMALSQMEPGAEKAKAVRMGLSVVTDRDQLESMAMQVNDLTDSQKINVLAEVIDGGNKTAAEVAREHYKFWTEEDYTDLAAARKWLDSQASETGRDE